MFGSELLEIAIGLVLVYLLLSLICTTLTEFIARAYAMRSKNLEDGLRNLLEDETKLTELYNHPLIAKLAQKDKGHALENRSGKPSYIPTRNFALALLDIVAPRGNDDAPKSFAEIRTAVTGLPDSLKKPLLTFLDNANGDISEARENIETWFDDNMERVSGWYRRKAQIVTLVLAAVVSILFNVDSIALANSFSQDATLRAAVVAAAEQRVNAQTSVPDESLEVAELQAEMAALKLPIGWSTPPEGFTGWLSLIGGLAITTLAVSLGAPFWFDILSKIMNVRATGKPEQTNNGNKEANGALVNIALE